MNNFVKENWLKILFIVVLCTAVITIKISEIDLKEFIKEWQVLVGSLIGAATPFLLWLFTQKHIKKEAEKEYLCYLERIIVNQVNSLFSIEETMKKFIDQNLKDLINNIKRTPKTAYSNDITFVPLFSVQSIQNSVSKKSSGSGYIDNKIVQLSIFSNDFPHIINDTRFQLRYTLEQNRKTTYRKLNPPDIQNNQLLKNIEEYKIMIERDLLNINIPLYFKKLIEALIPIQKRIEIGSFAWKIKFDPDYKFYIKNSSYLKAKENLLNDMDKYFEPLVLSKIEEIEKKAKENN